MTVPASVTAPDLEPIDLDELVARAELLTRVDRKYVLPLARATEVLRHLPVGTRILEIDGIRSLRYRSTYLDTPRFTSYLAAGQRRRRRWKVRTRSYLDSGTSWVEVKTRVARDRSQKVRVPVADPADDRLTSEGGDFVATVLDPTLVASLQPVVTTSYRRSTLLLPASGARATVDIDLGWHSVPEQRLFERPGLAVIETKTGAAPSELDRLLWTSGHRPVQLSKYGVGVAALYPHLPALKWARTLRRDLGCQSDPATQPGRTASSREEQIR